MDTQKLKRVIFQLGQLFYNVEYILHVYYIPIRSTYRAQIKLVNPIFAIVFMIILQTCRLMILSKSLYELFLQGGIGGIYL